MAELKTKPNEGDVDAFLASVTDGGKRADSRALRALMAEVTGDPGAMRGSSIVGFDSHSYRYERQDDVDTSVLRKLVEASVTDVTAG